MARRKKKAPPKPKWERPTQSAAEFAEEVAKRTERPFGMSQAGVDFIDNLLACALHDEMRADLEPCETPEESEFRSHEKAFARGIQWAVKAIRNERTINLPKP